VSGICGWLGATDADPRAVLDDMRRRMTWTGAAVDCVEIGDGFGLAATGSAETIGTLALGPLRIAFHGHGLWRNGSARVLPPTEICAHIATAYIERGPDALTALAGDFALALLDLDKRQALLAIDRMGVRNLVYRVEHETVIFAANLDALAAHPLVAHRIDPQALYNYVYFHMVPGPGTIFDESRRLLAGHYALLREGKADVTRYWQMRFDESTAFDERELEDRFRSTLRAGVEARAVANACGTFLSGGTDSSTVTGMLSEVTGVPVGTYSIGFDASGYDEMDYARIAAKHFRTEHHEYYVTPADVMTAIPLLAAEYDQPFGNASAVPTYYCAKLARETGVARMLAGDGGDELFGGNERYARQYHLSLYERLPGWLRTGMIEPLVHTPAAERLSVLRKGKSYIEQASLPMPARYESYNLLERLGPGNIFDAEFLATVDRTQPLSLLAHAYDEAHASSLINRLLALDLRFTLADNDQGYAHVRSRRRGCRVPAARRSRRRVFRRVASADEAAWRAPALLLQAGAARLPAARDARQTQAWLRPARGTVDCNLCAVTQLVPRRGGEPWRAADLRSQVSRRPRHHADRGASRLLRHDGVDPAHARAVVPAATLARDAEDTSRRRPHIQPRDATIEIASALKAAIACPC